MNSLIPIRYKQEKVIQNKQTDRPLLEKNSSLRYMYHTCCLHYIYKRDILSSAVSSSLRDTHQFLVPSYHHMGYPSDLANTVMIGTTRPPCVLSRGLTSPLF